MKLVNAIKIGYFKRNGNIWGKYKIIKGKKVFQKYHLKICAYCNQKFLTVNNGIYCDNSCSCYASGLNKFTKGKNFLGSRNTIGNKRKTHNGYITIYNPFHPLADKKGRVAEHRLVVFNLGHKFKSNEHVHHINGNRSDNRPENLQVLSHADHNRKHKVVQSKRWKRNEFGRWVKSSTI